LAQNVPKKIKWAVAAARRHRSGQATAGEIRPGPGGDPLPPKLELLGNLRRFAV
jgi:hypothetical protein